VRLPFQFSVVRAPFPFVIDQPPFKLSPLLALGPLTHLIPKFPSLMPFARLLLFVGVRPLRQANSCRPVCRRSSGPFLASGMIFALFLLTPFFLRPSSALTCQADDAPVSSLLFHPRRLFVQVSPLFSLPATVRRNSSSIKILFLMGDSLPYPVPG